MPIAFYYLPASGPCRAVEMTTEHLGIQMDKKLVDLFSGQQMKPEFLAMNPQHTVPTIDDDGFTLWESRAIMTYLVNQCAPESPLYPKDPKARAVVDKMLYYDAGNLFKALQDFYSPQVLEGLPKDPEKEDNLKKSLDVLEKILEKTPYAAGNHLTIVDYSILSSLVFGEEVLGYSFGDFPKISAWLLRMKKETPKYKEINEVPLQKFKEFWNSKNNKLADLYLNKK